MKLIWLLLLLVSSTSAIAECDIGELPPAMGGPVNGELNEATLDKWKAFREARTQEKMQQAWDPQKVFENYRIEQSMIERNCYSLNQLVDIGRALFVRDFTLAEGLGNAGESNHWFQRFQNKDEPQAHASSCANCHWKGGFAGGGDRVDNAFLGGDGRIMENHQERNPIPLHGIGWVEALAREMSNDLQEQKLTLIHKTKKFRKAETELSTKGVSFGTLKASLRSGKVDVDYSQLNGVAKDLVVKPFGWSGRFATIAEFVDWSFSTHLGLQSTTAIKNSRKDQIELKAEITQGQIIALSVFLATLSSPIIEVPTVAGLRPDLFIPLAEPKSAPEYTQRWARGQTVFDDLGCSGCHVPKLELKDDTFAIGGMEFSLHDTAAKPSPQQRKQESAAKQSTTPIYLFSDLKLHDMGHGVFITRPLWGLRNSAPYSFDGSANVVDQAIEKHGHPDSAALTSAREFEAIHEKYKADLRVFLYSLMRSPEIRIR